jgi:hypothetical protein
MQAQQACDEWEKEKVARVPQELPKSRILFSIFITCGQFPSTFIVIKNWIQFCYHFLAGAEKLGTERNNWEITNQCESTFEKTK